MKFYSTFLGISFATNKQTINRQHLDRVLALEWSRWIGIIIIDNAVIMDRMTASVTSRVILYHHWGCPATDDTLLIRLIYTNMNVILIYIIFSAGVDTVIY